MLHRIEAPVSVREDYNKWCDFMEERIAFWVLDSDRHTKVHCSRVLLFALLIAEQIGVSEEEKRALCMAAVFHDSRRKDDWYDVGHGARAASYYKLFCSETELTFHAWTEEIIRWHDRDDAIGLAAMEGREREILLYQIFKDADALDRFRLGPNGLDERYLRTEAAKNLCTYARSIWENEYANIEMRKVI